MKRYLYLLLVLFVCVTAPVFSKGKKEVVKFNARMITDFHPTGYEEVVQFKIPRELVIADITIPQSSIVTVEIVNAQEELRWHKSGYFLCKLKDYLPEEEETSIDISDREIYFIVRRYEKINKKEAWIKGTEIVLIQGASFFAPGVDVLYFFTKGAIKRNDGEHWFKAGVHEAYDNSIFWFPQKGKNIVLKDGDAVKIKAIHEHKVEHLNNKIDNRRLKLSAQKVRKDARNEVKEIKNLQRQNNKAIKKEVKLFKKEQNAEIKAIKKQVKEFKPEEI